ncbi:hypothetical protein I2I11_03610 [Pontibacter sp. 172403-2]|uniref:hypothetical protein n=1 Tax=Pontibacter rufus TaxID=2791028 RepID=UPI0018AF9AAB|nr:hypothetical protein [Pontibacter sp. 172403-2]MBF9252371.1 hypothetical protein [Pontibacter sp. 172403-2]
MLADTSIVEAYDEDGELIFTKRDTVSESIKLVNSPLNGDIFYKLAKGKDGIFRKKEVFKYTYRKEDFSISFSNDTTSLSAPFVATIYLNPIKGESTFVSIENEKSYVIEREEGKYGVKYIYRASAPKHGVNTFKGEVLLHEDIYPIQFRYFVK